MQLNILKMLLHFCIGFFLIFTFTATSMDFEKSSSSLETLRHEIRRRLDVFKSEVEFVHDLSMISSNDSLEEPITFTDGNDTTRHSKIKRAVIIANNNLPGRRRRNITHHFETDGSQVISRIYLREPQPFDSKLLNDLTVLKIKSESYIFSLENSGSGEELLIIYKIEKGLNPKEIIRHHAPGATSLETVQINSQYYVLVGKHKVTDGSSVYTGSQLYQINFARKNLNVVQTLNEELARTFLFWVGTGKDANDVFLGVVPDFKETVKGKTTSVDILVYRWQGGYFDFVYSIPAQNPQSISYTIINSHSYLAVANYRDDLNSTSIYSTIYKYNYKESQYVSFQNILTHGAMDVQHFSLTGGSREEHFLAIANYGQIDKYGVVNHNVKSYIFKFAYERFIPFQSLETHGAYQILPVKDGDNKFLLVIGELKGIRIFQYNGWKFIQTYILPLGQGNIPSHSVKLRAFIYETHLFLTIASQNKEIKGGIYALEFDQKNHNKLSDDVEKWCNARLEIIKSVNVSELLNEVDNAPKRNDHEIILSSPLIFTRDLQTRELFTKKLEYSKLIYDAKLSKELADRESQLKSLKKKSEDIISRLNHVVTRDTIQIVNSSVKFEDVEYIGHFLKSDSVSTSLLNGINIKDLIKNAIRLDKNYQFESASISDVIAKGKTEIHKLNGEPLSNYALKSSPVPQIFTAHNKFETEVLCTAGFESHGLVDGLDFFKKIDFLINHINQTFDVINLLNATSNNLIADSINGVNVKYYMNEAVKKSGEDTITGTKEFNFVNVKNWNANIINGHDMNLILSEAFRLQAPSHTFLGKKTQLEHVTAKSIEVKTGVLNENINIASDMISISSGTYWLDSLKLESDTFVKELFVNKSLNQIEVKNGTLDMILKFSLTPQLVANKVLDAIILEKNSHGHGLIDNVNLNNWSPNLEIVLNDNHIHFGTFKTNGSLTVNDIHIEPSRSHFTLGFDDVSRLLAAALSLDAEKLPDNFRGQLIFDSIHVKGNTKVLNTLNGLRTSQFLLRNPQTTDGIVRISAPKIFNNKLTLLASSSAKELFGSTEVFAPNILKILSDLLLDGVNQTITGISTFTELLHVDNLDCPLLELNEIRLPNIMLISGDQTIQGTVSFLKQVKVNNKFKISGNLESVIINGHNLTAGISDTLKISSTIPQTLRGKLIFEKELVVENLIVNGEIGGHNASTFFNNIIQNNDINFNHINGSITFAKPSKLDQLEYSGTMNGIKTEDWGYGLLLNSGPQTILTQTTFKNSLKADILNIENGKVSNFDVVRFKADVLSIYQGGSLGAVFFENTIDTGEDVLLESNATVNGYNLHKDILVKNNQKVQIITGRKVFEKVVTIKGDLEVELLSGFLYNQAAKFAFGKTSDHDNLKIVGNLRLKDELFFADSFNGEDWANLVSNIWWKGKDTVIDVPINFQDVVLLDGAKLKGLLNNENLLDLATYYLSKTKNQSIVLQPTFAHPGGVSFETVKVKSISIENGKVNGINLEEFKDSVILNGVDQNIKIKMGFENLKIQNIILENYGLVGGIDLDIHAMTIHGENVVNEIGKLTFNDLYTEELHLGNGILINGIDLVNWNNNAAKTNENNTLIHSPVQFKKAQFFKNVEVLGLVDGLDYTKSNIFTLSDDQVINGFYIFTQDPNLGIGAFLVPQGLIAEGHFNGLNITKAIEPLVKNDGGTDPLIVTGKKTFTQSLVADSVHAEGLYQKNDLDAIIRDLEGRSYVLLAEFNCSLEEKYLELKKTADLLLEISARKAVFFEYFEQIYEFQLLSVSKVKLVNAFGSSRIRIFSQNTNKTQIVSGSKYNDLTNNYQPDTFPQFTVDGIEQDSVLFQRGVKEFVLIAVRNVGNRAVSISNTTVDSKAIEYEIESTLSRTFLLRLDQDQHGNINTPLPILITQTIVGDIFALKAFVQFKMDGSYSDCVASLVTTKDGSKALLWCFQNPVDDVLRITQTLPTENPSLISTVLVNNHKTLLIIASNNGLDNNTGVLDVWGHEKGANIFIKEDCIPTFNLVSLDVSRGFNNNVFLALASGYVKKSLNYGQVYIYRYSYSRKQFVKQQSILVDDPKVLRFQQLEVSKESFLYILTSSNYHNLQVYSSRGRSGWILEHTLTIETGRNLYTISFELNKIFHSHIAVIGTNVAKIFQLNFNGLSYEQEGIVNNSTNLEHRS